MGFLQNFDENPILDNKQNNPDKNYIRNQFDIYIVKCLFYK